MARTESWPGLNEDIFDAEFWGISEALKIAEQKAQQVGQPWVIP